MKLENFVSLEKLKGFMDSAVADRAEDGTIEYKQEFKDADGGLVLAENLIHTNTEILKELYPENVILNSGLTIDNSGDWSTAVRSLKVGAKGGFRTTGTVDSDKGKITLSMESSLIEVVHRSSHTVWTYQDIMRANKQGINLANQYIEGVYMIYQQEVEEIMAIGSDETGIQGLFNYGGFDVDAVTTAASTLSAEEKYQVVANNIATQQADVNGVEAYESNVTIMSVPFFKDIQKEILNSAGGTKTVLAALKENFPGHKFMKSPYANDVAGTSKLVSFSTDKRSMVGRIPLPLEFSKVTEIGFQYHTDMFYAIAGLDVLRNDAARVREGL